MNRESPPVRKRSGKAIGAGVVISLASLCSGSLDAKVIVRTVPEKRGWMRNNANECRVDIYVDTTQEDIKNKKFISAQLYLVPPEGLNYLRSDLPDSNNPSIDPNHPQLYDANDLFFRDLI